MNFKRRPFTMRKAVFCSKVCFRLYFCLSFEVGDSQCSFTVTQQLVEYQWVRKCGDSVTVISQNKILFLFGFAP